MKKVLLILTMAVAWLQMNAEATLKFLGSTPSDNGIITSFNDIVLSFDLSDLIEEYGEADWGICANATYKESKPDSQKSAQLFKGTVEDGELLARNSTTIKWTHDEFVQGDAFHISFPDVEVIPGQLYTLKITYDMFAVRVGIDDTWIVSSKYSFFNSPLVLTLVGGTDIVKVLRYESSNIIEEEYDNIDNVKINFNYDVNVLDNFQAQIVEGSEVICSAESYSVDALNSKSIEIKFPDNTLYKGHNYSVEIPEGCVSVTGESDVFNSAISLPFKGSVYKHYSYKSILPRPGTKSLLEEVQISFDLPQGAGLVYVSDDTVYPLSIYKVNEEGEDQLLQTINGVYVNDQTLKFNPTCDLEWESRYKFVMEEDVFKAYEIGAIVPKRLEEYICDRIEFVCATPDRDDIPKVTFREMSDEELTMDHLDSSIRLPMDSYEAMEESYVVQNTGHGYFPLMVSDGITTSEIGELFIQTTSDQNGLYLWPRFFRAPNANNDVDLNLELEAGKTYTLTIPEGRYAAVQSLLKKYSGNEVFTYVFHGTTPTSHTVIINGSEGHATKLKAKRHQDMEVEFSAPENRNIEKVTYQEADNDAIDITEEAKTGSYLLTDICNDAQFFVTLDAATPVTPDFVNVSLTVGHKDNHSVVYSHPTVKSQAAAVNVSGANGWTLESLSLNDEDVDIEDVKDGVYTIPAESLDKDAALNAVFAYSDKPIFDFTTGVDTVDGCDYRVYSEDSGTLVIENIPANTMVSVYSTAGLHIVSENCGDRDVARIPLAPGIYVVVIGQDALKIKI